MFGKKKEKQQNNSLNITSENYKMCDSYKTDNLVVANLEYISSEATPYGPMVKQTEQRYIFELLNENGKTRYREIFTGFIADAEENHYFDLPYVVNITSLKGQVPSTADSIPKYALLLVLNEINAKKASKKLERKHR